MGVLCKKVENGGVFFCKEVDISSTQGALCTVSVLLILHFIYLEGCIRTQRTPPAYGPAGGSGLLPNINTKNCSLSIVLTATDQKPQKSLKR